MVATFPEPDESKATLFKYLKRCPPQAPLIAPHAASAPLLQPLPTNGRRLQALSRLLGVAQAAAIALGVWVSTLPQILPPPQTIAVRATPATAQQQAQDDLWQTLGSDALAQALRSAQAKQTQAALADAQQERLQAQQLRLDAEAQAQNLTNRAAEQAREKTIAAVRSADLIALDATYIGAEQVLYAEAKTDVTLKFAARIQCKDGSFGETAVASPLDSRITPREVRNLAACFPSTETAAGKPIGQAGEWGVAFFKLE